MKKTLNYNFLKKPEKGYEKFREKNIQFIKHRKYSTLFIIKGM